MRKFVIIFDGMTFNGEAFVLVLRFVDDTNAIRHLVWRFKLLSKPMTATDTATVLAEALADLGPEAAQALMAAVHDRAAGNMKGVQILQV
jgi:hypothetical protein